jgi:uncharacterized protein (DUF608 family)
MRNKRSYRLPGIVPALAFVHALSAQLPAELPEWQVLKSYDDLLFENIAMPVGGIGTGTISLGGRGDLRDWELMNRPGKGYVPTGRAKPFFALSAGIGGQRIVRLLEGPIGLDRYDGFFGSQEPNHGMPRFRQSSFWTTYPFAQVNLADPDIPLAVSVEAYNPLVPLDAGLSGLPVMALEYKIRNLSGDTVRVSVCGNVPNFIGNDGYTHETRQGNGLYRTTGEKENVNEYREEPVLKGIFMYSKGVDRLSPSWGTMALVTTSGELATHRTSWQPGIPFESLAEFWEDLKDDGLLGEREGSRYPAPMASLAVTKAIAPGEIARFPFFITWHFPNRETWTPVEGEDNLIGNYYCTLYEDAWQAATEIIPQMPEARSKSIAFVNVFAGSDYPDVVKEAALFNLTALRSQTSFRTPDGFFHGYEGCFDHVGCCFGNCTHVWNYETATAFLFGDLSQKRRISEFLYATDTAGLMSFRMGLPMETRGRQYRHAAADGQLGCLMKLYRDWQLSGDDEFLRQLWPMAKKALAFAWVEGGWDEDADGVMEGCQHNTMDVSYFGPNPQMMFWYLGALRSAEEMALYLGEKDFAGKCRKLFRNGSDYVDEKLFNGEYYIQLTMPSPPREKVYPGLYHHEDLLGKADPKWQIGEGCLVDQLVGQYMAHVCGLGYLADSNHIRTTLRSIMKYNYRENMYDHFNNRRSYVLGHESALLMVDYPPHVKREVNPFIYATESMTGFEYTAAIGMIYEDMTVEGLVCIRNIRDRFDGIRRSPFDEAEAGHHYARAMASWTAIPALGRFHYSAVEGEISFGFQGGTQFWSTGHAWGTARIGGEGEVYLKVMGGAIRFSRLSVEGLGIKNFAQTQTLREGEERTIRLAE